MSEQPIPTERDASSSGRDSWQAQPSLSEISHLFLTGLRQRQTDGAPLPLRKPPAASHVEPPAASVDVTPEEISGLQGEADQPRPRLSAVLAHHLPSSGLHRVREYARHVAVEAGRVGLIELGDDGLRLTCFDAQPPAPSDAAPQPALVEPVDGKRIAHAIEEMSWDVDRWILFLPAGARSPHARKLLGEIGHWTLLAAADDAGLVSAYRTLKSVAALTAGTISLVVLDAEDEAHEMIIHRKLSGASKQFLKRTVEAEGPIEPATSVTEHIALWCRSAGATSPQDHWIAVAALAGRSRVDPAATPTALTPQEASPEQTAPIPIPVASSAAAVSASVSATSPPPIMKLASQEPACEQPPAVRLEIRPEIRRDTTEVLDLPLAYDAAAILAAILKQNSQWVASPIKPPMCTAGTVAVDRAGTLHLLACGLDDLRSVSHGYGWLKENRALVKLAAPQMNIDAGAMPRLTLFVDQAEVDADQLAPILQSGHVTIKTYRRLRWGEKTGLLLEAA